MTVVDRVKLSLSAELSGLSSSLNEAHLASAFFDSCVVSGNCSYNSAYHDYAHKAVPQFLDELNALQKKTGWKTSWNDFDDNFRCRRAMGVPFPAAVTEEETEIARYVVDARWRSAYCTFPEEDMKQEWLKMVMGAYMGDLSVYLTRPFTIVAAHDASIAPLAAILFEYPQSGFTCGQPNFASFISIEVHDGKTVKVLFRDGDVGNG